MRDTTPDSKTRHHHVVVIDWGAIDGLEATLGENGVTSNYRFDLALYTWQLVQSLEQGKALFGGALQPTFPPLDQRRHQADLARLVAQGQAAALAVLERHAQGARVAGRPGVPRRCLMDPRQ